MNKKKNPSVGAFAEINLQSATGLSEYVEQSSKNTWKYIRLVYPNGVSLILPYEISSEDLSRFIKMEGWVMTEVCTLPPDIKYFLYHRLVDMRKQFVGLQGIVNDELGRYVTADEAFVFIGIALKIN